ncbi:unnamed protein product [Linum trigynum]|uniref:Uncharacterized protein n=1 Tax=Linum trigynum TaxID=586398 RepID=A0AAV2D308_9ROSI
MGSGKAGKPSKSRRNPNKLGIRKKRSNHESSTKITQKMKKTNKRQQHDIPTDTVEEQQLPNVDELPSTAPRHWISFGASSSRLMAFSFRLSSWNRLTAEECFVELSDEPPHGVEPLGRVDGKIEAGNPAVLFISASALRAIELLRDVRSLTKECHAGKLFSKHMKVEEQVAILKNRVNFASGTPSRIKKLIDIEAIGVSRLKVVVLDLQQDVKGYLFLALTSTSERRVLGFVQWPHTPTTASR